MNNLNFLILLSAILFSCLIAPVNSKANWIIKDTPQTAGISINQKNQNNSNNPDTQSDSRSRNNSLPKGVTKEWLNSLTDENGNSIIPESKKGSLKKINTETESDSLQENDLSGEENNNYFGYSVSSAGDVNGDGFDDVIVGAYGFNSNTGKAYIYFGGSVINNSVDVELKSLIAGEHFGYSVSSAGDVNNDGFADVIVGAKGYSSNTGRAYIYLGGVSMNDLADGILTGEVSSDFFGWSVSTAGDVNNDGFADVIVGAKGYSSNTGRAYIYLGSGVINNISDVTYTGESANNFFGYSVSSAGDIDNNGYSEVMVGAYGINSGRGRVYVYFGTPSLNSAPSLTISGLGINYSFGISVSSAGDVNGDGFSDMIIGAHGYSSFTGRAYVYFGSASPDTVADITMTGESANNFFANSVSSAGDVNDDGFDDVIIGAYGYSSLKGRTYIYFGGTSMNNTPDETMTGEAAGNHFGKSVSGAGDMNGNGHSEVISGAFNYSSSKGKAYLYEYIFDKNISADFTMAGMISQDQFGCSVSDAGDVNGDGYSDVIIGAKSSSTNSGISFIYFGGPVMDSIADVGMSIEGLSDRFGHSVSGTGDVNGDGFDDVIIGAPGISSNTGRAYIYFGGAIMNNFVDVILIGVSAGDFFGGSVSGTGDINGDGFDDVIVGAKGYSSDRGRTYVFFGGSSMNSTADLVMNGEAGGNYFGFSVSDAGDVNGDGYSDYLAGAYGYSTNTGRAYLFYGGAVPNNIADVIYTGLSVNLFSAWSVSGAGDVNNDGFDDVIVGAPRHSLTIGKAFVYLGGAIPDNTIDVTMTGEGINNYFGISVSSAGDVNGDGYSDVIIGGSEYLSKTGRAFIYLGGSIMNNAADRIMQGETIGNYFGYSVSTAGDMNGDGYSDVISGAYGNSGFKGRSYIFISNPVGSLNLNLTMFIEGFYNAAGNSQVSDTVTVQLRNAVSPYSMSGEVKKTVSVSGMIYPEFINTPGGNYYIVVRHRNSIETWSAFSINFSSGNTTAYNLSLNSFRAYGNNQIQVDAAPVRFAVYSGDVNQDGTIDLTDGSEIDNDAFNFNSGYLPTDVNGDGIIDVSDAVYADNNGFNFVGKITP